MRRSEMMLVPSLAAARVDTSGSRGRLIIEEHHALFRHVADRIARALAADAGILHPAIGELVGAPGRAAVDDDAAGAQAADGTNGERRRGREDAGLQSEPAFADGAEYGVDIVI